MKQEIRAEKKRLRNEMNPERVQADSQQIAERIYTLPMWQDAKTVLVYFPLGNEVDLREVLKASVNAGKRCALPITDVQATDLRIVEFVDFSELQKGAYGIFEPETEISVPEEEVDIIFVPGIAFDKKGGRIGFGKGYYDRLLSRTEAIKIGVCYDFQLVEDADSRAHDVRMDFIVTEKELIECE